MKFRRNISIKQHFEIAGTKVAGSKVTGSIDFSGKIWLNADLNKDNKTLVYLPNTKIVEKDGTKKKDLRVLASSFMKDELNYTKSDVSYKGGFVYTTYITKQLFGVTKAIDGITARTVCRASPNVPTGIKTLNTIFDPSKSLERKTKEELAKKQYHDYFGKLNVKKAYEKLFELFWYTKLPCFDVKGFSKQKDEMSVIKRCYWRGEMVDCASIFVTRPTDRGMCCTFNVENAEKVFKATRYGNVSSAMQKGDKAKSFGGVTNK